MVVFSFRISQEMALALKELSERTHRSRSGVIRWLISEAAIESGISVNNSRLAESPENYSSGKENNDE